MTDPQPTSATMRIIDHPTPRWVDGLPLGNGDVGMVVHGSPQQVTLGFSKSDVWDDRIGPGQGLAENKTTYDELVSRAAAGDWAWCDTIYPDWLARENCSGPSLQPCGQVDLCLLPGERSLGFVQSLDLTAATLNVHCECSEYREGLQAFNIDAFVPARDSVIPVTMANVPGQPLFGALRLWRHASLDCAAPRAWTDGATAGLDMAIPDSVTWTLAVRVLGAQGAWESTSSEAVFSLPPTDGPVVLLVTIATSLETDDPHAEAARRLEAADASAPARLAESHRRWWQDFWSRSRVQLPDEALQRGWHWGLYLLGSSSQPGKKALGLQGVWNQYNRPAWHTDYHADGNVEIMHWPGYTCNHLDLLEPFYRLFSDEMIDEARRAAKAFFNRRGFYIPIAGGPRGHELAAPWAWPGAGSWIAQHFWWQYLFGRDEDFLRTVAYPFMRELMLWYDDFLQTDDAGVYHLGPSFSPEMIDWRGYLMMWWGRDVTMDLAMLRVLLGGLIEASEILDTDTDAREHWRDVLAHLAGYPQADGCWRDLDRDLPPEIEASIPRIAPLWPAGEVDAGSPEAVREIAGRTYDRVRDIYDGGGHCSVWLACAAAQLGMADEAVASLHKCIDNRPENGMNDMMQLDASYGTPAGIAHLLLQSVGGVLRVFPAVPEGWTASFKTLRGVGAFLVSAKRVDGRTVWVAIDSEVGGPCVLADPFGGRAAQFNGARLQANDSGRFVFETLPGGRYELTPASGGSE